MYSSLFVVVTPFAVPNLVRWRGGGGGPDHHVEEEPLSENRRLTEKAAREAKQEVERG